MSQLVPYLNFGLEDNYLNHENSEYFYNQDYEVFNRKMFIAFEGLNSGVPTRTTPTLTPTTLKNIEQTFIELQSKPEQHENEAGFVPPMVQAIGNNQYISINDVDIYPLSLNHPSSINNMWHSSLSQSSSDSNTRSTPPPPFKKDQNTNTGPGGARNRRMGGRKAHKDISISPEEEERQKIRRERNKAAAARCRKRRVDHTNQLIAETEELQAKKAALQKEYEEYLIMKHDLESILDNHISSRGCRLGRSASPPEIKPHIQNAVFNNNNNPNSSNNNNNNNNNNEERIKQLSVNNVQMETEIFPIPSPIIKHNHRHQLPMLASVNLDQRPSRPNSLNVASTAPKSGSNSIHEIAGVSITTPSNGLQFNFDSLMVGGTGLTPVSGSLPSCGIQQRNNTLMPSSLVINPEITSPNTCESMKLFLDSQRISKTYKLTLVSWN